MEIQSMLFSLEGFTFPEEPDFGNSNKEFLVLSAPKFYVN